MLLHYFICTLTAYNTNASYAVTKQKKDEMPPRVLLHSGMRLQAVTQQSKKAIIDQRIAARQTFLPTPLRKPELRPSSQALKIHFDVNNLTIISIRMWEHNFTSSLDCRQYESTIFFRITVKYTMLESYLERLRASISLIRPTGKICKLHATSSWNQDLELPRI